MAQLNPQPLTFEQFLDWERGQELKHEFVDGEPVGMAGGTEAHNIIQANLIADENVKTQATETLAAMGLSVSDAVRVFLTRVAAEKQLPFALKVPNAETRAAIEEADAIVRTRRARFTKAADLFNDLEKNRGK